MAQVLRQLEPWKHPDLLVQGDQAYIIYFTHPGRTREVPERVYGVEPYETRRTVLQVARLEMQGETLVCDRDRPFDLELRPEDG
jgi:hypothetical protein